MPMRLNPAGDLGEHGSPRNKQGDATVEKRSTPWNANRLCRLIGSCSVLLLVVISVTAPALAAPCESLSALKLPDTTIISAQVVAAGAFEAPSPAPNPAVFKEVPAFCRVTAEIKPAAASDIKIEVWMPVTGWNGKDPGAGNGGFAGGMPDQRPDGVADAGL